MPFSDLSRFEDALEKILENHQDNLEEAATFGLRLAALPKLKMGIPEAQKVVASFLKDTEQIKHFVNALQSVSAPAGMETEYKALLTKAQAKLKKFTSDYEDAKEALEKFEDALAGEYFQAAFEAVRLKLLDYDPADDLTIKYTTSLNMQGESSWAKGTVTYIRDNAELLVLHVGYRAEDDYYWGDIQTRSKKFTAIVNKKGHTFLPRFARELAEQVKAADASLKLKIFTSGKAVPLKGFVAPEILTELGKNIQAHLSETLKNVVWRDGRISNLNPRGDGKYSTELNFSGRGWATRLLPYSDALYLVQSMDNSAVSLSEGFEVQTADSSVWEVTPSYQPWEYRSELSYQDGPLKTLRFTGKTMSSVWPAFMQEKFEKWPVEDLRKVIIHHGLARDVLKFAKPQLVTILNQVTAKGLTATQAQITYTVTLKKSGKGKKSHLAQMKHLAGAADFYVLQAGEDVNKAWRDAIEYAHHDRGYGGYSGTIAEKNEGYKIKVREPMSKQDAYAYAERTIDQNDKWGEAFAIPVIDHSKPLTRDLVTVVVKAKSQEAAVKKGTLVIQATGKVPPGTEIIVEKAQAKKLGGTDFEVSGLRLIVKGGGKPTHWLFYGFASS